MPLRAWTLLLLAYLLAGCLSASDEKLYPPIDSVPPRVVETLPEDGWMQVPTKMDVKVWFSEAIDPQSVYLSSMHLVTGQELVAASYLVSEEEDGRGLVVMRPLRPMVPGVVHRLRITTGVQDLFGNPLSHQVEISFSTLR